MNLPSAEHSHGSRQNDDQFEEWTRQGHEPPVPMTRFVMLYVRSRRVGWAVLTLALLALGSWIGSAWLFAQPEFGIGTGSLRPLLIFATFASASVVGTSADSPFGETERTAARPLPPVRFGHLAALLLIAVFLLLVVLTSFDLENVQSSHPVLALVRNLGGLGGLTLLTARLIGARLSWTVPLAFVMTAYLAAKLPDDTFAAWAWHMQPGRDGLSWIIAAALIFAGLAVVSLYGTRENVGESE